MRSLMVSLAVLLSSCGTSPASTVEASNLVAQPVTAAGNSVAVYMTLQAKCAVPDVLESVSAQSPQRASLVVSSDVDVKLVMKPLASIPIDCGKPNPLKPMGSHVLVTGIARPVGIGERIPLTLHFRDAGDVAITAEVTSMAVLENVDPMNMRRQHQHSPAMQMHGAGMH